MNELVVESWKISAERGSPRLQTRFENWRLQIHANHLQIQSLNTAIYNLQILNNGLDMDLQKRLIHHYTSPPRNPPARLIRPPSPNPARPRPNQRRPPRPPRDRPPPFPLPTNLQPTSNLSHLHHLHHHHITRPHNPQHNTPLNPLLPLRLRRSIPLPILRGPIRKRVPVRQPARVRGAVGGFLVLRADEPGVYGWGAEEGDGAGVGVE